MPTYQYRCLGCDHEFEAFQKMTDDPLTKCPECNGAVKRLISSGAGIIFKGEGFYCTDYRSDSYRKAAEKEKSGGAKDSTESKKSESPKPESVKTDA